MSKYLIFIVFLFSIKAVSAGASNEHEQIVNPTALDVVEKLLTGHSPEEIFNHAFFANIRVEPEFLGVKFYDTRSGLELDEMEIRELMGPIRQDGAYQLLELAIGFSGNRLRLQEEQLQRILDAAFIASMRNPPGYMSIEYYDVRNGPTGRGGGVSGSVPEKSVAESSAGATHEGAENSEQIPVSEYLPDTEEELEALIRSADVRIERKAGYVALPIIVAVNDISELQQMLVNEIAKYEQYFNVQYEQELNRTIERLPSGIYRAVKIAYFSGEHTKITELEEDVGWLFY